MLVRHLLGGPLGFQELRTRSGIAPRVLLGAPARAGQARLHRSPQLEGRPRYELTERGRSLEPIITATARWYLRHGLDHLQVDPSGFSATSARSILESLPFLLREDRAADVDLTFEIRLSGLGGGVWTVRIADGACTVREGFAERADVRYTAEARVWCAVALGIADAKDVYRQGLMTKDGGREAMDFYFHQIARTPKSASRSERRARQRRARRARRSAAVTAAAKKPARRSPHDFIRNDRRAGIRARRDARLRHRRDAPGGARLRRGRGDSRRVPRPGLGAGAHARRSCRKRTAATARARSPVTNAIVLEELALRRRRARRRRRGGPSPFAYAVADQGTDAQRAAYLPPLCGERYPRPRRWR